MSEKLRRCRKELSAALDRAFEDIVAPSFVSPQDYSIHVVQECQTSPSTSSPKTGQLIFGRSSTSASSYVPQPLPVCYSKENVYPALFANPIAANVNRAPACQKRRPLASKENVLTNPSSHDCQPIRASGDIEKCKKLNPRKETDRIVKQEVSKPQNAYSQEITKDLLDIIVISLKCINSNCVIPSLPSIMCNFVTWNVRGLWSQVKRQKNTQAFRLLKS
ncbi:uncharacterized protein C3orf62 homolog isoform X2 [Lissotriton helveticus]